MKGLRLGLSLTGRSPYGPNLIINGDGSTAPGAEWAISSAKVYGGVDDGLISAVGGKLRLTEQTSACARSQTITGLSIGKTYQFSGEKQANRRIGIGTTSDFIGGLFNIYNSNTADTLATSVLGTFVASTTSVYFTIGTGGQGISDFDNLVVRLVN
jgi:hypothetical protein